MKEKQQIIYGILVVIGCFIVSTVISLYSLHTVSHDKQITSSKLLASSIYDHLQTELMKPYLISQTLQDDRFFIDWLKTEAASPEAVQDATLRISLNRLEKNTYCDAVYLVSDKSLGFYTKSGVLKQLKLDSTSSDSWYTSYRYNTNVSSLIVARDETTGQMTCFAGSRIMDENNTLLGVCLVGIQMNRLQEIIQKYEDQYDIKIALADNRGLIQVATDAAVINPDYIDSLPQAHKNSDEFILQHNDDSADQHIITKHIPNLNWYLVISQPSVQDDQQVAKLFKFNLIAAAIILVIVMLCIQIIIWHENRIVAFSYTDALTSLSNRFKLNVDLKKMSHHALPANLAVVSLDVNYLKETNDNFGHAAGDELISAAGTCIRNAFENYGTCYRTGGDEFIAIIQASPEELATQLESFAVQSRNWKGHLISTLSISYGFASREDYPAATIQELIDIADKNMYINKNKYHHRL